MLNEESGKLGFHVIAEARERERLRKKAFNGEFNGEQTVDGLRTSRWVVRT